MIADRETFLSLFFHAKEDIRFRAFLPRGVTGPGAFKSHGTIHDLRNGTGLRQELTRFNRNRGIYFVVNLGGDEDVEITRFNACFAEWDDIPIAEQNAKLDAAPV